MNNLFKYGFGKKNTASAASKSSANTSANEQQKEGDELDLESDSEADRDVNNQPAKRKKINTVVRKYDPSYLAHGFICAGTKETPLPQCILCDKIFANSSMKPGHMIRHLQSMHVEYKEKSIEFFERKRDQQKAQSKGIDEFSQSELKTIKCSFVAAYNIVKQKKTLHDRRKFTETCADRNNRNYVR